MNDDLVIAVIALQYEPTMFTQSWKVFPILFSYAKEKQTNTMNTSSDLTLPVVCLQSFKHLQFSNNWKMLPVY